MHLLLQRRKAAGTAAAGCPLRCRGTLQRADGLVRRAICPAAVPVEGAAALLVQSHGRSSGTALQKLREGCYCVEGTELKRLLWQLYRMPGRQNRQLEQRCSQLYAAWGIPQGDVNAGYLSCAVGIACSTSQKLAIRKEILQAVSEQFDTSVAAVESGIRRMVDQLEEIPTPAWLAFKADTRLGSGKPTTGKLIYAVRDVVLRQKSKAAPPTRP